MGFYQKFIGLQMTQSYAEQWVIKRKRQYCRKIWKECSDGHRTGKCCL